MNGYVNASIRVAEWDRSTQIDATELDSIHIYTNAFSMFITETALNEMIQLVQQSQREKKPVRPHRENDDAEI